LQKNILILTNLQHLFLKSKIFIIVVIALFFSACGSFEQSSCDTTIDKKYFQICYDYSLKAAKEVKFILNKDDVDRLNIEQRYDFYIEPTIPREYGVSSEDYIGSGYDRGHLASDASFDFSKESLYATYSMANIVAQEPSLNRGLWLELEKLERKKAKEYNKLEVDIKIYYDSNPLRLGVDEVAVPSSFFKSLRSLDSSFHRCYMFENIPYRDDEVLEDFEVDCKEL
jgi:endonuclease G